MLRSRENKSIAFLGWGPYILGEKGQYLANIGLNAFLVRSSAVIGVDNTKWMGHYLQFH